MDVSAVILSSKPVNRVIPGITVVPHVSVFSDIAALLAARLKAIEKVQTPHFFFLDDDDDLPENYLDVLQHSLDAKAAVAYTNEVVRESGCELVARSAPYNQALHLQNPMLIHHLALCDTQAAKSIIARIPQGVFAFEPIFYFELAAQGAAHVDRVGYVWNKSASGLSQHYTSTDRKSVV